MKITRKFLKKKRLEIAVTVLSVVVVLVGVISFLEFTTPYALTADGERIEDPWVVMIGEEEAFIVASEKDGKAIIKGIKQSYFTEDTQNGKTELDPALTVVEKDLKRGGEPPLITAIDEAVNTVVAANKTEDPAVVVTTVEKVTKEEEIDFETEYKKTSSLYLGETRIIEKGEKGKQTIVKRVVKENGEVIDSDVISKTVEEEPKTEVVEKGTKPLLGGSAVGSGSGGAVVNYAMNYLGTPYRYGGSSLTKGTDCSGFTMSVYRHYGIKLPHSSKKQRYCGRGVSYSEAKPGDLICYSGHVAIYIGNGKIVHANNTPGTGVSVSKAKYRTILAVRRIVE